MQKAKSTFKEYILREIKTPHVWKKNTMLKIKTKLKTRNGSEK
jgi:hypothetical protein